MKKLDLIFLWHMHQPDYRDHGATGGGDAGPRLNLRCHGAQAFAHLFSRQIDRHAADIALVGDLARQDLQDHRAAQCARRLLGLGRGGDDDVAGTGHAEPGKQLLGLGLVELAAATSSPGLRRQQRPIAIGIKRQLVVELKQLTVRIAQRGKQVVQKHARTIHCVVECAK